MGTTYYLSTDISSVGKQLGKLKDWEKEIAEILLSSNPDKLSLIKAALTQQEPGQAGRVTKEVVQELLDLLPKGIRGRAKIFLHHATRFLQVDDDGLVRLPDGSQASALLDVVRFYCTPSSIPIPLPQATDALDALFREHHLPLSAFAKGRNPYENRTRGSSTSTAPVIPPEWITL